MLDSNIHQLLVNTVVCSVKLAHASKLITVLPDFILFDVFCELQATINNNYLNQEKCLLIIQKIKDQDILKNLAIAAKNFNIINEILTNITSYSNLKVILASRPELETHIKGRLSSMQNSARFILDD